MCRSPSWQSDSGRSTRSSLPAWCSFPMRRTARASTRRASKARSAGLVSRWIFHPHPDGCQIDFELEFDFRSILLQQTVRLLFAEAVRRMVSALKTRAKDLYGKSSARPATPISSTR